MISSTIDDLICNRVFIDVSRYVESAGNAVYLKIEAFNPAGSIKIKAAKYLLDAALASNGGAVSGIIESSSGNMGIALAMLCAARGIHFECVVDPNILEEKTSLMRYLGAQITVITKRDANGGYLGTRIDYIKTKLQTEPGLVWTNQYANEANTSAHYKLTAAVIHDEFPSLDYLFIGAGTTGTLYGCTAYFALHSARTKVVAIDSIGSVTFGGPAGERFVPGIGTSQRPGLVERCSPPPDDIVNVGEYEGVKACRRLSARTGLLVGGSTGSVIAGFERYVAERRIENATIVLVSPDLGQPYLSTIYSDAWVKQHFPSR